MENPLPANDRTIPLADDERAERLAAPLEAVDPAAAHPLYRRRWLILSLLCLIIAITFIDRLTLSILAPVVKQVFHLSDISYSRVVSAFQFGMMAGEVPVGMIMDRWGARLGLFAVMLWWASATGAQGFLRTGLQMGVARFAMGTSECGSYSGGTKTISNIFPRRQRTLALGIFNSGSVIGSIVAPPVVYFIYRQYGFRAALVAPSFFAAAWVVCWWFAYRAPSGTEMRSSALQTAAAPAIPMSSVLSQSAAWAVMFCRFFVGPVIQFYWWWLPIYLDRAWHLPMDKSRDVLLILYVLGGTGGVAGGAAGGWLIRSGVTTYNTRRIVMFGSAILCMASMIVPFSQSMFAVVLFVSIVIFGHNFLSANMFASITDLFHESAVGRATGLSGIAGGVSGVLVPLLTGVIVQRYSFTPAFLLVAVMPLIGVAMLFLLGRRERFNGLLHARQS